MKDLVAFIARELVEAPDDVEVTESGGRGFTRLELRVAQNDVGKVIGRQGRVAQSIRALVKVAATREGVRATVDIV
jgi:predicted RNA-binding protein YlqC (UPF0109 family)